MKKNRAKMTERGMVEVINAYLMGDPIQSIPITGRDEVWRNERNPTWNFESLAYRIKPKDKLEPYDYESFLDAITKHKPYLVTKTHNNKDTEVVFTVLAFTKDSVLIQNSWRSYEYIMNNYDWMDDNTPCGVLDE